MSKAQGEKGSASEDQAWSPSRLGCGGGDGLTIYFISSCLVNPVGESGSGEAVREVSVVTKARSQKNLTDQALNRTGEKLAIGGKLIKGKEEEKNVKML